ncbi:uncharacterized protein LOC142818121 [Rhipicephalus microplus]|uniref:uncharacterized protein LOC142818121 n=1 Tax=Rhipicephalus microplus TaxID=6941 RepID=UPI003F6BDD99
MARAICSLTLINISRGTGGVWLPSFRGQILQLTGMTRFSGDPGLYYQERLSLLCGLADTLLRMSSQCDGSLEQNDELLEVLWGIETSATFIASAAQERAAAAQKGVLQALQSLARAMADGSLWERDTYLILIFSSCFQCFYLPLFINGLSVSICLGVAVHVQFYTLRERDS